MTDRYKGLLLTDAEIREIWAQPSYYGIRKTVALAQLDKVREKFLELHKKRSISNAGVWLEIIEMFDLFPEKE